jgi:hypothetical protein
MIDDLYGRITHPTIQSLSEMVLDETAAIGVDNAVLFKLDLRSAFSLLNILPQDAGLSSFELTNGRTLIQTTGWFGWTGMPGSFHVITRIIVRLVRNNPLFKGRLDMFVDDILGICALADLENNLRIIREIIVNLLGPDSVEDKKTEWGRRLDWIGWSVDLDNFSISVASHNMLKTLYGFFSVNVEAPVSLAQLSTIASWAARYSLVCRFMRPHTSVLFAALGKYGGHMHVELMLDQEVAVCIQLWRCCLVVLDLDNKKFARNLTTFRTPRVNFIIGYDAALSGVGIVLNRVSASGREHKWKCAQFKLPWDLMDSGYQNAVEYIALVSGFVALAMLGVSGEAVAVRGDNISSLSWALRETYKGSLTRNASVVFTLLGIEYDLSVAEGYHVPGESNIMCDALSRYYHTPQDYGYVDSDVVLSDDNPTLRKMLALMDPRHSGMSSIETAPAFIAEVQSVVLSLRLAATVCDSNNV